MWLAQNWRGNRFAKFIFGLTKTWNAPWGVTKTWNAPWILIWAYDVDVVSMFLKFTKCACTLKLST